ncbi:signal peptidase I [Lentisphaerota bacterium WC36G]|nr:signal peptidase I [Lentisphaerae bacterium WC36]
MFSYISKKSRAKKIVKDIYKHTKNLLHYNDDIYSDEQKKILTDVANKAETFVPENLTSAQDFFTECEQEVLKVVPKNKLNIIREYVDIIAVAFMVAFGVRGLFLQPFKIPTGSMQPTLFGIHYVEKGVYPNFGEWGNLAIYGGQQAKAVIATSGRLAPSSIKQLPGQTSFEIGNSKYNLPGTLQQVLSYTKLMVGRTNMNSPVLEQGYFQKGETLCDGELVIGDHLFVDRFTLNFTGIKRGDIIVFNTVGLMLNGKELSKEGYYYIKRLVGMPGDELKIVGSRLFVKEKGTKEFKIISELDNRFKKIYSNKGGYHGHTQQYNANYLSSDDDVFIVPEDCYFMMGDNSLNSQDSRYFGAVPRRNIVGKALFVFWPFNRRWGAIDCKEPLNVKTEPRGNILPAMNLQ